MPLSIKLAALGRYRSSANSQMAFQKRKRSGEFLWALMGRGSAAALQALALVLLARLSNPADFGLTMGVQGVLLTAAYFLSFGLGPYILFEQAKEQYSRAVVDIWYVNRRTSLLAGLSCFIGLTIAGLFDSSVFLLLPLSVAMLAMRNSAIMEGIALANGSVRMFGASLLLRRLMLVLVFGLFAIVGINPLLAYSTAYAVSEVSINLVLRRVVGRVPTPIQKPRLISVIKKATPYWVETVSVQFRGLDVSSAGLMGGAATSGIYAVPARLSSAILMVPSTFANLCLPRIASGTPRTFVRFCIASVPVTLCVFALLGVLAFFAEPIIVMLLGDAYASATVPTQIFCVGFAVLTCITIANALVQGIGLARHVAWTSIVGALLVVLFVGVGAALFGAEGSSWGFSLAVSVQLLLLCSASIRGVRVYLKSAA